ncbi:hypothetical protein LTR91_013529 [Friedmanniomyces endolithicus]|nr:hypothetical protein LTS09_010934 [Friedmanniomyces endolithicus]KAK0284557.1 hypothetical protein LTR35_005467 [Friedmanniomyces endolithicus]KAK0297499.1 hypothetical protein LTS00_003628 [Friedmanniomyces endolithicus]KAK0927561.1 hypothetical protein LTR57_003283 [Friedmanniomyces endolithicus]KAK0938039.1 hypothetical protein LTR29_010368 [Friedmanniomyces endolithicus]
MLQAPGTHVRQRSITRYDSERKDTQASEPLLDEVEFSPLPARKATKYTTLTLTVLWAASLVLTALCTYLLTGRASSQPFGSFERGFATDLESARTSIRLLKRQFHGSLDFKGHHGFVSPDSPSIPYLGATPEVDAAWNKLSDNRYFLLSDAEAEQAYGPGDILKYWNSHHGG